jgi:uncharacterized membrane protein
MDAHHGAHLAALRRHPGMAQPAGAAALSDPFSRRLCLAILGSDADVAAEADDVAETQLAQEGEQLLVAEAAVGQDRHPATWRRRQASS